MTPAEGRHGIAAHPQSEKGEADRFANRVVVVTGAARGIGAAIARRFLRDRASVVAVDRDPAVAELAAARHDAVMALVVDLADAGQCASVVDAVVRRYGRIDVLVNNAADHGERRTLLELCRDDWARVIGTNLTAAALLGREAARVMAAQRSGAIVNMTSIQEYLPVSTFLPYVASKGGISALTRAMAVDLAPFGVRVNAVAPGLIDSPSMTQSLQGRADLRGAQRSTDPPPSLLRRFGTAEEVAAAVAFLASTEASFVTGVVLPVDGGRRLSRHADPLAAEDPAGMAR